MRCSKCNNENPDDAVCCLGCYSVLLKIESAALESAPAQPAPKLTLERQQPIPVKSPSLPWRQIVVVVGAASATLLIVSGALWMFGGHGSKAPAGADPAGLGAQWALDHAFSEARAVSGEKVALARVVLLTAAPVAEKNVPSQTLGTYAGWVFKKAQAVLADSGRDCQVSVQVTLHPDVTPSVEIAARQGQPEAALLQRLRRELEHLGSLHTSAQDVSFGAYCTVKSGVAVAAGSRRFKTDKPDMEALLQACGGEIGMFCNEEKANPASLVRCLRGHSHDLLDACRQQMSMSSQ